MKKLFFLLITVGCVLNIFAQDAEQSVSVPKQGRDTTSVVDVVRAKAQDVMATVFRPEPTLNNADSIIKLYDDLPSFGIYKNNYVVTGTAIGPKPTRENSDAKFQISVSQRLTNSVLPLKTYLFLTYTQLAYWDIYKESFPFGDINYNPTIGFGKALAYKNRFLGVISFQLEHESNGRDNEESRSWNKISFNSLFIMNQHWTFQTKAWIPLIDGQNNRDIVSYKGWGHMALEYNNKKKYNVGLLLTKRAGAFFDSNIVVNFSYRLSKNENQYLFMEYYNGYGENLLFYNHYRHRLRIGFVIQPTFLHMY